MNLKKLELVWVLKWGRTMAGILALLSLFGAQCSGPTPALPSRPPENSSITVAVLTPMTGELATFGENVRNGVTLAFDEWNDQGGARGQFIRWVLEDTRCDPLEARRAAERVINQGGARLIVGGVCSESAIPIARVASEHGVLFVATTATHPLVTVDERGNTRPSVFRAGYAYPYQGGAAARFALDELNARRAAVLTNPTDDYVRSLGDAFKATFVGGGGQVVANPAYDRREADWGVIVAQVARAAPDVLYVPDAYPVANRVGSQVLAQGINVILIGSEIWDSGGLDLEVLEGAYYTLHFDRDRPDPLAQGWRERYLSAFAAEPDTLAALGYDAAHLLASAIESAGSTAPDEVARTLESIEFEGVTGRWHFDAQHDPLKPVLVVQIEGRGVRFYEAVRP